MALTLAIETALTERAAAAYHRARELVYDQLPPAHPIDPGQLSSLQRDAIEELVAAEAALASYRDECYEASRAEASASR